MAARTVATSKALTLGALFLYILYSYLLSQSVNCWAKVVYSRTALLKIGSRCEIPFSPDFKTDNNVPTDIAITPTDFVWWPRRRRRRRGQRGGCVARLKSDPNRPAIPSLFLANARSLAPRGEEEKDKMDDVRLRTTRRPVRDCCCLLFTETWGNEDIPDASFELAGFTAHRQDRNMVDTGKGRGGGLLMFLNNDWTTDSSVVSSHCSQDLEYITVKCRPFHLAREHCAVLITIVYIAPDANANNALAVLHDTITSQQRRYPDAVHVVAGDFNHVDLKKVLPKLYQHVKCATRGNNTLDKVYSNIKNGYRAIQQPPLGSGIVEQPSDHMSLLLIPAYTPIRRSAPTTTRMVKTWPEGAMGQLQDCFENTDWSIFENEDLEQYTAAVLGYIKHCIDTVTVDKQVKVYPNTKPWMTKVVTSLLKERDRAFKAGDQELYSVARANLKKGIREAKAEYRSKIEDHLQSNNTREVWQGVQHLTNFKPSGPSADGDASKAEELNRFFARFERAAEPGDVTTPPPNTHSSRNLILQEHEVRRTLRAVNPRKATGPDGVPGQVLRDCADQLAGVFTNIFSQSLSQAIIPSCLKTSTIIPVPKKNSVSSLNDYRPVALTSVAMKCFEKLVRSHITSVLPPDLDPYQFAYRANRSTEDAIATTLHSTLNHLEQKGSYARLLFVDYSSAFNTIMPDRLVSKMAELGVSSSICQWTKNFLTDRPQRVKMGRHMSSSLNLSTGSPQGCVLSPLLYSLYTYDCKPTRPYQPCKPPTPSGNYIIKFADDTTVVGLISEGDESAYCAEVEELAGWCAVNNLALNTSKTKEVVVDYRRKNTIIPPLVIGGDCVERASSFCFLGVHLDEDLTWSTNTSAIVKKAHQRLHFLRVLRNNHLPQDLLVSFYRCSIESILTYCFNVWFWSCTAAERTSLQRVVNTAQKIIGCPLPPLADLYSSRCLRKAQSIVEDPFHPGHGNLELLPSGRRYRALSTRTSRFKNSFYPRAITALNENTLSERGRDMLSERGR